jgi:phosphatidylglycerophosphate synthase
MLDGLMRRIIDPPLTRMARALARANVTADALTSAGLVAGLCGAALIVLDHTLMALCLIAVSRLLDGLDGAVARATAPTDLGGYLDIVFDFIFYGAVPLAFAWRDPADATAAAVLLFAFYANGASFLAYAAIAARLRLETASRGEKNIYFTAGLAEGTETIAAFAAMCVWPAAFAWLAFAFATACLVTCASRVALAIRTFR